MEQRQIQTALILSGGMGTRLQGVLPGIQKVAASVGGEPFLFRNLRLLEEAGIQKAVLCTGHLAETVHGAMESYTGNLSILYSHESAPLGTGGALKHAASGLMDDSILAMNGDSFFEVDLRLFIKHCIHRNTLLLREEKDISRFGSVELSADGRITAFREKMFSAGAGLINGGIYILNTKTLCAWEKENFSLEKEYFPYLAVKKQLYGFLAGGRFIDIGTPESLCVSENFFGD